MIAVCTPIWTFTTTTTEKKFIILLICTACIALRLTRSLLEHEKKTKEKKWRLTHIERAEASKFIFDNLSDFLIIIVWRVLSHSVCCCNFQSHVSGGNCITFVRQHSQPKKGERKKNRMPIKLCIISILSAIWRIQQFDVLSSGNPTILFEIVRPYNKMPSNARQFASIKQSSDFWI